MLSRISLDIIFHVKPVWWLNFIALFAKYSTIGSEVKTQTSFLRFPSSLQYFLQKLNPLWYLDLCRRFMQHIFYICNICELLVDLEFLFSVSRIVALQFCSGKVLRLWPAEIKLNLWVCVSRPVASSRGVYSLILTGRKHRRATGGWNMQPLLNVPRV